MATALTIGLRHRLIDATVELLGERGPEGTKLREIARRAGVSHGAPLRHFPSLTALLSEVAAEGFRQLEASVEAVAGDQGPEASPLQRLAAGGRGYVSFALANRGVFGLMWRADLVDFTQPALAEAAPAAFASMTRLVEACQRDGWHAGEGTALVAGSLWATVHGLAQLWLLGVLQTAAGVTDIDAVMGTTLALVANDRIATST